VNGWIFDRSLVENLKWAIGTWSFCLFVVLVGPFAVLYSILEHLGRKRG